MPLRPRRFRDDEHAITGWDIAQILALILIPAGLFVFWYQYLRRIGRDEAAKDPFAQRAAKMAPSAGLGDQKRTCSRCGVTVRPPRGSGPPTCPNCMSVL